MTGLSDQVMTENAPPINARADIQVSPDKMEARLMMYPPENGGAAPTLAMLSEALKQKGVIFGVNHGLLAELSADPVYNRPVAVAAGQESVPGGDAEIIYYIKLEKSLAPKVRPDGTVDFKQLDIMVPIAKDEVICEKRPATQGTPGANVHGKPLPAKPGRDLPLPTGKNTALSEDKLRLLAAINGQADVAGKRINVLDFFTVDGDVSPATGNISFGGNVVVTGNVLAGFSVQAGGNIDIYGTVDSAAVKAGGLLMVRGGFNGSKTGTLTSGSHTTCRFIQGGHVITGGDLETTYVLNATVHCGGSVNVTGKGLIMGGHITARASVNANMIGNANTSMHTVVEVGSDAQLVKRSYEIPKEQAANDKNLRALEVSLRTMLQLKNAGRLTEDHAGKLEKTARAYDQLKTAQEGLREEYADVKQRLSETGQGVVRVQKTAYPGVKIIIGSDQLPLQSEFAFTSFKRTPEGIVSVPMR